MRSFSARVVGAVTALAAVTPAQFQLSFTDATAGSGVNYTHTDRIDTMGGGVCMFDYDNDGDPDMFATSRGGTPSALFQNRGNGTFVDVSAAAGMSQVMVSMGAYAADLNNDGFQDVVVLNQGADFIFQNNGDGTFTDVTSRSPNLPKQWSTACSFSDFDRDGDLDIAIGTYIADGIMPNFWGGTTELLRNDGNFVFTDIAKQAGVEGKELVWDPNFGGSWKNTGPCTLSILFYDYDLDGWQDLVVGNDFGPFHIPNQLFRNDRNGRFTEVAASANFRIAEFNMGLVTADVNGDLIPDLYTSNFGDNHLLLNNGRGRFFDAAPQRGVKEGTSNGAMLVSWAALFLDANLDSRPDLYVSNGFIDMPQMPNDPNSPSRLFMNLGQTYSVLPEPLFPWDRLVGRGAARADIDLDGDEDIIQVNNKNTIRIFRNDCYAPHRSATLDLVGTISNRDGVGAKVTMRSQQYTQVLEYTRGGSYLSNDGAPIIRGLADDKQLEEVEVLWPSGVESHRFGLMGNQRHEITEPRVTIDSIGTWQPIGSDYMAITLNVQNHAGTPESVQITSDIALGGTRYDFPAWHFPVTVAGFAKSTVTVYVPLPDAVRPLGRRLGAWIGFGVADRDGGMDEAEQPIR